MEAPNMTLTTEDLSAIKSLVETIVDHRVDGAIDSLSVQIGEGFNEVAENFADLRTDIAELKTDVRLLKIDMVEVKTDIAEIKLDMREVKWGLADTVRRSEFLDVRDRVTRLEHQSDH